MGWYRYAIILMCLLALGADATFDDSTVAGLVVVGAGYSAAFLSLGGVAAIGSLVCFYALPETRQITMNPGETASPASAIAGNEAST